MYQHISTSEGRLFSVSRTIVVRLSESIARGEIDPGERLPPSRDLAKILNVSHQDLRTGRRLLIASGIFTSKTGVGTFLSRSAISIDPAPFRLLALYHGLTNDEIFEARISLGMLAASFAAKRASSDQLITMAEEIAGMFASVDDADRFLSHDLRFHQTVAYASHNRLLMMLNGVVPQMQFQESSPRAGDISKLREFAETNRRVYQVVRDQLPDTAKSRTSGVTVQDREERFEFPRVENMEAAASNHGALTIN